ncbi:oxygen-independent coproporphyrinogen III oxidase [Shinella sp. CPCC 101442]|uniref:oxygen-independent coproporphyrinogen III oxidase n=1 Tax=Shinella sp. CPCC 101442 TaxID=2932265 RepID=UPI002153896C|nr:oxygen-independent coproporphyrinogen III oxidase [Shinella sp. CPCC 101442]MCR6499768.1 oxygen-independent coproporphyrinogen III oxidase [Shinella sp. CPCC 101442]
MQDNLVQRLSSPVPRYTSYPTAPHFNESIGPEVYSDWLASLSAANRLSLYVHIPYCDRLCWFCACHTKQTLRYEPVEAYLKGLHAEIGGIGGRVAKDAPVTALHFGGGSPTLLRPDDMRALKTCLDANFTFADDAEISVEMDPNDLDDERHDALADIGMTRASLGIQDFDPKVQKAINRIQTFEQTRGVVEAARVRGVRSVNCDILYGLPFQTMETLGETVRAVISLAPDRIALFGYAHVPWMKKHQTMIDEAALPGVVERFGQMRMAAEMLLAAGYEAVGIDHFALPADRLAVAARNGTLRRNFQGYTDDQADALIGLGASAIGQLPQGYIQNMPATSEYLRRAAEGGIVAVRGYALTEEDRARAFVIERVMCDFGFSFADVATRFPAFSRLIRAEANAFAASDRDGLCRIEGDCFLLTATGRPFARTVAAVFDAHLSSGRGRHSMAV